MRRIVPVGYSIVKDSNNYHENASTYASSYHNQGTPTRPSRARLTEKDNNALIPTTPQKSSSKHGMIMPRPEKQQSLHARPALVPSVAGKPSSRTPLTPRIAGSTPSSNPTLRRAPRPAETNGTPLVSQKKEEYTPAGSALFSNNITPRSGSRRSRIESPNTTPTATPTPTAPVLRLADPPQGIGAPYAPEETKRPSVTFAPASEFTNHQRSQQNADSKFFFASDAKVSAPSLPQKPNPQAKASTFFYANGDSIPPVIKPSGSAVGSSIGDDRSSMFFHANGAPDISSSSNISTARIASPRLAASAIHSPRPTSPFKANSHSSVISSQSTPAQLYSAPPRPTISTFRGQSAHSIVASRRISVELRPPHGRTISAGSFEHTPPGRNVTPRSPTDILPVTPLNFSSVVTVATPERRAEERDEARDVGEHGLGSPMRAGSTLEQINELAAEARRDRKVLDLEITNSSLEAINRTIERQLRKQTAELRRYRRLSRSGRLSLANSSGEYSMTGIDGTNLSDMSEGEEDDDDGEENTSEEGSMDDGSLSPGAMAESDARHRQKDEQRLRLDLSKHQQLIADSQAMNSSIKRCLAWSEELINECKKALAYNVRPSDVTLGGRVLISEEIEIDESEGLSEIGARLVNAARQKRQASLSPSASSFGGSNRGSDWGDRGGADRDSGIEVASYQVDPNANNGVNTGLHINIHPEHSYPAPP